MTKPQKSGGIIFPQGETESVKFSVNRNEEGLYYIVAEYIYGDTEETAIFGWHFNHAQLLGFAQFLLQFVMAGFGLQRSEDGNRGDT